MKALIANKTYSKVYRQKVLMRSMYNFLAGELKKPPISIKDIGGFLIKDKRLY